MCIRDSKRIDECHHLVIKEFQEAVGDPKRLVQVQRKMDSLQSLSTLAKLAGEVVFSELLDEPFLY